MLLTASGWSYSLVQNDITYNNIYAQSIDGTWLSVSNGGGYVEMYQFNGSRYNLLPYVIATPCSNPQISVNTYGNYLFCPGDTFPIVLYAYKFNSTGSTLVWNVSTSTYFNNYYAATAGTFLAYTKYTGSSSSANLTITFYKFNGTTYKLYGSTYTITAQCDYTAYLNPTGTLFGVSYSSDCSTYYVKQYIDNGTSTALKYSSTNVSFGKYNYDGSFYSYTTAYNQIIYLLVYHANFTLYSNISTGYSNSITNALFTMGSTTNYILLAITNTSILIYQDNGATNTLIDTISMQIDCYSFAYNCYFGNGYNIMFLYKEILLHVNNEVYVYCNIGNCMSCSQINTCNSCGFGTYLSGGSCVNCPTLCNYCTSSSVCQSCFGSGTLYNNLCYASTPTP
jgi:hypothetical protein